MNLPPKFLTDRTPANKISFTISFAEFHLLTDYWKLQELPASWTAGHSRTLRYLYKQLTPSFEGSNINASPRTRPLEALTRLLCKRREKTSDSIKILFPVMSGSILRYPQKSQLCRCYSREVMSLSNIPPLVTYEPVPELFPKLREDNSYFLYFEASES